MVSMGHFSSVRARYSHKVPCPAASVLALRATSSRYPVSIDFSDSRSSATKSKNVAMRGVRLRVGVRQYPPAPCEFGDWSQDAHQAGLTVSDRGRKRPDA